MNLENLKAYTVISKQRIEELKSDGYLLKHNKTGARVALLSNDDENKVFYIGFRTPPKDSTGVAHIIEHTVLCGSEKYPVKDPFIELAKGSLNTFLNAMTYPDKTVYPVASCNSKDFKNLMDVYLDAVLHPNIYHEEKIFRQEGWHYELESADDELTINGVVYNEMKGAFSSPDDVLYREIMNSLYPHTSYAVESGGDPDVIPELTYEDFLAFHQKYYHPSNSYIYLYGDMDMEERLAYLDREYLSGYEALSVDSAPAAEPPFQEMALVEKEYPIMESEPEEGNTYLSYNVSLGENLDRKVSVGFQALADAVVGAPGAPVRKALLDAGIGTDISSFYEADVKQPYFSIVAKNAEGDQREAFVRLIEQTLQSLFEDGVEKKALRAALNHDEFRYREADYGSYPKGLMYGLQMFETWLYDDGRPFDYLELDGTYKALKGEVSTAYYENMLRDLLMENTHKSVVVVRPVRGLTGKRDKALAARLAAKKASMTQEEIAGIVAETKALADYQEEPDREEDLEKIPLLAREDIGKKARPYCNEELRVNDTTLLYHEIYTNGIGYLRFLFDLRQVPEELFPYVGLLQVMLGLVDTEKRSYSELYHEIHLQTGGIAPAVNVYTNADDLSDYKLTFDLKVKTLYENLPKAFELAAEILTESVYTDAKRLFELVAENRSDKQAQMMSAGHSLAAGQALSYLSKQAHLMDQVNGLSFYRLLEGLEKDFEGKKEELSANMERLVHCIFRPENLMVDYTAQREGLAGIEPLIEALKSKLHREPVEGKPYVPQPVKKNEGLMSSAQIQYVCRAGNYANKGFSYTGALRVLKVLMSYEYLWMQVRVRGGAYGCMCQFGKTGESYFVSYRDPNLEKTIETYEKAADFVEAFEADERTMTQYIIGAVSAMDMPLTPAARGNYSLAGYMTGFTFERAQQERDELLSTDAGTIRKLAAHIRAFMEDDCLCVVGNEEKIKEQKDIFGSVEYLTH
ncbi:MAG: insulinase family protein [Lachnospiraceae bacterium]|jgi:Zn-dependent M16 (insulinase) family peptidase|nr:insulinase family protein [Lachnospiraceae bacterium]